MRHLCRWRIDWLDPDKFRRFGTVLIGFQAPSYALPRRPGQQSESTPPGHAAVAEFAEGMAWGAAQLLNATGYLDLYQIRGLGSAYRAIESPKVFASDG